MIGHCLSTETQCVSTSTVCWCRCEQCEIAEDTQTVGRLTVSIEELFLAAVLARVAVARAKYPGNTHRLAAVLEEAGEVARALNKGEGSARLREECIDLAACALRLALEGDASFDPTTKETTR